MVLRKHSRKERNKKRQEALTSINQLDDLQDRQCFEEAKTKECKCWRDNVEEEDQKLKMDRRQRSRQLWLHEGDTNTEFFHMSTNGKRRQNQILKVMVGDQEHAGPQLVGQALSEHFCAFSMKGKRNRWKWCGKGNA